MSFKRSDLTILHLEDMQGGILDEYYNIYEIF